MLHMPRSGARTLTALGLLAQAALLPCLAYPIP